MSLYDWLLFLHVLSAFALVAGEVLFSALTLALRNRDLPGEVAALFRTARAGDVLVGAGAVGTLVFGIWLAIDVDGYELWDPWIIGALVLWALFVETGRRTGKEYYKARDRANALVAEGRLEARAELRTMLRTPLGLWLQVASVVLVLLLLLDMIYKPGA